MEYEYTPSFPARLVPAEEFVRSERPQFLNIDPRQAGTWGQRVDINLSLQNQWCRNEAWYWEAMQHQVLKGDYPYLRAYCWQPEYPAYEARPGFTYQEPVDSTDPMDGQWLWK